MKEELAVDKLKQQEIQNELKLPKFEMGEQIEVDEDEVSDDFSDAGDEDPDEAKNQEKKDNYNKIKERLRKQKFKGGQQQISKDRLTKAVFKLMTNVV